MAQSSHGWNAKTGILGWIALALWLLFATQVDAGSSPSNADRELGHVDWLRDYDVARERSLHEGKPILILFQEVPGCQTCVSFGEEVLSHPLLVEAIEDEFIPLAILNNKPGRDRRTLEQFREPAWNNPVVRFIGRDGQDLIPRRDRVWKSAEIAKRMSAALEAAERPVPDYLRAISQELGPQKIERATFAMACYWEGEACLGALPGLLSSRTGDLEGHEVVELKYDPTRLDYQELLTQAKKLGCADNVFTHTPDQLAIAQDVFGKKARRAESLARTASPRNQKYHLKRNRRLQSLDDLTPSQAIRLNHTSWAKDDPNPTLSPRQRKSLHQNR